MNTANSFLNQQAGFAKWNAYDMAIKRLSCRLNEVCMSIFPNENMYDYGVADTPIFACKFAVVRGYEHMLALADEDGRIAIYNTESKGTRYGGGAHKNAIFDLAWFPKRMKFVSAAGDHTATLFNIADGAITIEKVFQGHTRSLKAVACRTDDSSVFASGGRDGKIIIWDPRIAKSDVMCMPDVCLPFTHFPSKGKVKRYGKNQPVVSANSSVTGLVFQDDNTLISCGSGDGVIKVWDMRKNYYASDRAPVAKYMLPHSGRTSQVGFSNLLLDSTGTKLYANCLDHVIYCYNVATYHQEPIMQYRGHKNSTFYIKSSLSADNLYLFSGSSDFNAYIWNVSHSKPLVKLQAHNAEVSCVAWSGKHNTTTLVTCSDDLQHKIWRVGPEIVTNDFKSEYCDRAITLTPEEKQRLLRFRRSRKRSREPDENSTDETLPVKVENVTPERNLRKRRLFSNLDENIVKKFRDSICDSPTRNLPNFVVDGSAPHLIDSPIKEVEKDWLTKLRLKRLSSSELLSPKSPKTRKTDLTPSKIDGQSPRSTRKNQDSKARSSLLKFFKVTNNTGQQCRAKSPNSTSSLKTHSSPSQ